VASDAIGDQLSAFERGIAFVDECCVSVDCVCRVLNEHGSRTCEKCSRQPGDCLGLCHWYSDR